MEQVLEGGCLCGAVRYRGLGHPTGAFCHCQTCRKAIGAPVTAWLTFSLEKFSFTRGEPVRFRSSAEVVRTFCGLCGTSLTYSRDGSSTVDVTSPSLDEPEKFQPLLHVWGSQALGWVHFGDNLPTLKEGSEPFSGSAKPRSD
jgi:hypothetical protein